MRLLALNCGSSSVKFAVVDTTTGERIVSGAQETGADGPASAIDAVVDQIAGNAQLVAGLQGIGHRVRDWVVPIVPAAIIFDLNIGDAGVRPTDENGFAATAAATADAVAQGTVGAGTGATVGKALGGENGMKGGVGCASLDLGLALIPILLG